MDKIKYMERLKKKLNSLPQDEIEDAIRYYEEYFEEAGPENEQKAAEELGSPEKAAAMIKANYAVQDMEKSKGSAKKSIKTIFIVILAIFASPIAIPIAVAIFAVLIALLASLLGVFISLLATGAAAVLGGLLLIVAAVLIISQSTATFVFFTGFGLVSAAAGAALVLATAFVGKACFGWIAGKLGKLVLGRRKK